MVLCFAEIILDTSFGDEDKPKMSVIAGGIGEFNSSDEDWSFYTERLQQFFIANDVLDASKQRAMLLSACGAGTYTLIRSLVTAVNNRWTGLVDWTGGLDWWTGLVDSLVMHTGVVSH